MLTLSIRADYGDPRAARAVLEALEPDNGGYVTSRLEGGAIVFEMGSESAGTLRSTMDDLMACLKAAEDSIGVVSDRRSPRAIQL